MTSPAPERPAVDRLRLAIVLAGTEDDCTVVEAGGRERTVRYAVPFPRPRADRVAPGHLVAVAAASDGTEVVVWRWFDAVVLGRLDAVVTLWEPNHGSVDARPRSARHLHRPGSRAYLSAGLPGADWWVAGPAVAAAEDADVDVAEVADFLTGHGLWDRLT